MQKGDGAYEYNNIFLDDIDNIVSIILRKLGWDDGSCRTSIESKKRPFSYAVRRYHTARGELFRLYLHRRPTLCTLREENRPQNWRVTRFFFVLFFFFQITAPFFGATLCLVATSIEGSSSHAALHK